MKLSTKLLRWYDQNGRDLPWRKTRDPYKILVSEIMLQQTQVDRVKGYYKSWLKQFPSWKALASASNADVIRAWSGLGYNRRALALRDIAKQVVKNGVPQNREEWLELKGVGPYTSAALTMFAQQQKAFPIDTVIRRVAGRLLLGEPFTNPKRDEDLEKEGLKLLDESKRFFDIPQALFDLGSDLCSKTPRCGECRLQKVCKSAPKFLAGTVQIPKRSISKANERIYRNKKHPDRIYRGRILKLIQEHPNPIQASWIGEQIDPVFDHAQDQPWLEAMLERLHKDELIIFEQGRISLAS